MSRLLLLLLSADLIFAAESPVEIVRRSTHVQRREAAVRRQYTWQARETSNEGTKLFDVLFVGGKQYRRLLEKNGRLLEGSEAKREQSRIDKAAAEAARLTANERARREAEADAEDAKEFERLKYVPDAFDFTLVGEPVLNGRPTYQIAAEPKRSYNGKYANLLNNVRATLFIDQRDLHWARVEGEALQTVSVGLFLARIAKGTLVSFEETRVNEEVWLPKSFHLKATGRLALLKKFDVDVSAEYRNYRRFSTDSRVVSVGSAR
jgi:hypothetical protein